VKEYAKSLRVIIGKQKARAQEQKKKREVFEKKMVVLYSQKRAMGPRPSRAGGLSETGGEIDAEKKAGKRQESRILNRS